MANPDVHPIKDIDTELASHWSIEAKVLKCSSSKSKWTHHRVEFIFEDANGTKIQATTDSRLASHFEDQLRVNQWYRFNNIFVFRVGGVLESTINNYKIRLDHDSSYHEIEPKCNTDHYDIVDYQSILAGIPDKRRLVDVIGFVQRVVQWRPFEETKLMSQRKRPTVENVGPHRIYIPCSPVKWLEKMSRCTVTLRDDCNRKLICELGGRHVEDFVSQYHCCEEGKVVALIRWAQIEIKDGSYLITAIDCTSFFVDQTIPIIREWRKKLGLDGTAEENKE